MNSNRLARLVLLALMVGLAGCASTPVTQDAGAPTANFNPSKDPYWEDPRWDKTLLDAVQAAVRAPADPADMSTPDLHATVKFTFLQGVLEYPEIVTSTGNPDLDKLMLHQIAAVQAPQGAGLRSDEPHEFVLDLDMPTPFESFRSSIYAAIDYKKIYPKEAIISGSAGNTVVEFDYVDGKANNIAMTQSSKSKGLDNASLNTVARADLPPIPAAYSGKTLHITAVFCYTIFESSANIKNPCPTSNNVIVVQATRIKRVDISYK